MMIPFLENIMQSTRRSFLTTSAGAMIALKLTPQLLRAAEKDADGYVSLFDGKTLKGWHKNPQRIGHGTGGDWKVEEGVIVGQQDPPASGNGGILLTDETFGDFEVVLDLKPDWGVDSGFFIRSNDKGQCIQMMVDYHNSGNVGHLYGEGTGGWNSRTFDINGSHEGEGAARKLVLTSANPRTAANAGIVHSCTAEEWLKAWKVGDWNTAKVRCTGKYPVVTTWINGLKVCEWNGETSNAKGYDKEKVAQTLGAKGSIAVQVHGGKGAWPEGAKCRWRNIRVKEL